MPSLAVDLMCLARLCTVIGSIRWQFALLPPYGT